MVKFVKTLEEFNSILSEAGNKLVVVDFTAQWCGPCRNIAPFFQSLAEHSANKDVIFIKVDVDEAQDVATKCDIKCMPTFHFYRNGQLVHEFSGADKGKLEDKVEELRQQSC